MRAPTGDQFVLRKSTPLGEATATIVQVAAGLRELSVDGVALTSGYGEGSVPPFGCGIVLVPWPNRIPDGIWTYEGKQQRLAITEPRRQNAIHGLLRNTAYTLVEKTDEAVTLAATVYPQSGYPFLIDTTVRYELVDDGIKVTHTIENPGARSAPVAIGTHPFLTVGDVDPEDLTLTVHAGTRFEVDERLNFLGEIPVDGKFDLREGARLGDVEFDDAFGEVAKVSDAAASLTAPDGRRVELWQDESFPYVQVFTTRKFPGTQLAVAIEPMTAPANAFNTGIGLRWLEPGQTWVASWGIRYSVS